MSQWIDKSASPTNLNLEIIFLKYALSLEKLRLAVLVDTGFIASILSR